ncbi:Apo-citrate lyase phosphoribosyl-dephospho-CoA transferase [Escherichia coli]|uniref:Apo-citrate lyase phosphoribosyl-dephospho-CoA transferase n=1 Tax=Escherichia coli TaxID=562 RepID=A0A3P5DHW0_ECOLX|nr:Apo-citrate lyase phosphoribosyl-dephospho-CoA transferase [Escherichia coli]
MLLLPELASHHAVSIPELLVSRDETSTATRGSSAILFHWSPLPWLRLGRLKTARSHAEFLIMA